MEVSEHIASLRREGDLLAAAAARTDPDTPVPTCPDWRVRDLIHHIGGVHRWAAAHVDERRTQPIPSMEEVVDAWPVDAALADWFRDGHDSLVRTLETAEPDLACWTFLPAPSPLAFWARRQAHETGIHRVDAESPGGRTTPFAATVAVDGIDELLFGFVPRPGARLRADPPRSIHLRADDTESEWRVRIGPEGVVATRERAPGDCSVHGSASELFLLLWNRRPAQAAEVRGDGGLLDLWQEKVRIQWT